MQLEATPGHRTADWQGHTNGDCYLNRNTAVADFQELRQQTIANIARHLVEGNSSLPEGAKILDLTVPDLPDKVSITLDLAQQTHTRATLSFETMMNVLRAAVRTKSPFQA